MSDDDIRDRLRVVLENGRYSLTETAEKTDIPPDELLEILDKKRALGLGEMLAICDCLGVNPEDLYRGKL